MVRRAVPEGIRVTKVGFFYILITLVVGVAAANTGNNALYIVEACLLSLLVFSGLTSRHNLRRLEVELVLPDEAYANQPFAIRYRVANHDPLFSHRMVELAALGEGAPVLVPYLKRRQEQQGRMELMVRRRGVFRIRHAHLHSIFPLGLFRKGLRLRLDLEMLVFPEIFGAGRTGPDQPGQFGDRPSGSVGWGHELLSLRRFRPGDDRRSIHWKQTARAGHLIFMERESERGQRLSVLLDNAVGELHGEGEERRFERLVSEAATAAHNCLEQGIEIELVTRECRIPFGIGRGQRLRVMRELALIQPVPRTEAPLLEDWKTPRLRLAMEPEEAVAP